MSKTNLEKLLEQRAQLEAKIQQMRNREASNQRKRDTRRKVLAGAYVVKLAGTDLEKLGRELIAAGMLSTNDFDLFGISISADNFASADLDIV